MVSVPEPVPFGTVPTPGLNRRCIRSRVSSSIIRTRHEESHHGDENRIYWSNDCRSGLTNFFKFISQNNTKISHRRSDCRRNLPVDRFAIAWARSRGFPVWRSRYTRTPFKTYIYNMYVYIPCFIYMYIYIILLCSAGRARRKEFGRVNLRRKRAHSASENDSVVITFFFYSFEQRRRAVTLLKCFPIFFWFFLPFLSHRNAKRRSPKMY